MEAPLNSLLVFLIHTSAGDQQTVQVVVEGSYVKNPRFFVVELAGTSNCIRRLSQVTKDSERVSKLEPENRQLYGLQIVFCD